MRWCVICLLRAGVDECNFLFVLLLFGMGVMQLLQEIRPAGFEC